MGGWGKQTSLFLLEDLRYGAPVVAGPASLVRHLITPNQSLAITFGQRSEGSSCPERFAHIANGTFHASFLVARADLTGAGGEVVMRAEFNQPRIEMDFTASALDNRAAQVLCAAICYVE